MYQKLGKRLIDILVASLGLLILSPIFIIVTICLYIGNKGKPFFLQQRPGKNERIFKIIKFKSMNDKTDSDGRLLPDFKRLTAVGGFVRKTSIDELPQLINVLKGDMSLIGPRPLLIKYLRLYSDEQRRRHNVLPGITGWAQVNGRNAIDWEQKFALDVWYVDNLSFLLDMRILWLTFIKVLKKDGVNQSSDRPMEPFKGNILKK